jgi:glycosyltransferase involved in cell wall biosynthesis
MKIIVVASKSNFDDYSDFVNVLNASRAEAIIVDRPYNRFLSKLGPVHFFPNPELIRLIKSYKPDLVITDLPDYTPRIAKLTNRKVFYHMLGDSWSELDFAKTYSRSFYARINFHYLKALFNDSIKEADLVLANSKWLLDIVKEKMPTRSAKLFYTGINSLRWFPEQKTSTYLRYPAVVGVFDFEVYQKVLGLIKFTRVVRRMPDVNFYFVGDGPYFNSVKQMCPQNMFLIGRVSKPQVKNLLDGCSIFVHPSGLDVLPRSVKEASLMAKPIIASNVGGIPEMVKDNQTGYLCDINNVNQWIEKIRFLLDNPDISRTLGKNARKFVLETYDWTKIANRFLETFKTVAN